MPMFREKVIRSGKTTEVARPLFPRYLFVQIVQQWSSLAGTYGVSGIVKDGASPKYVPQKIIDKLKSREDKDGFILLDEDDSIKKDDPVKVMKGPFEGHIGIFQGMTADERAVVLFKMLGSERELKLDPKILVAV